MNHVRLMVINVGPMFYQEVCRSHIVGPRNAPQSFAALICVVEVKIIQNAQVGLWMLTLRQSLENEPDVPALVLHGNARFKKVAKKDRSYRPLLRDKDSQALRRTNPPHGR